MYKNLVIVNIVIVRCRRFLLLIYSAKVLELGAKNFFLKTEGFFTLKEKRKKFLK